MSEESSIEVFIDEYGGTESVGLVLRNPSIVEYEDELTPGCKLASSQAMRLAAELARHARQISD